MRTYIKKFENESEYAAFVNSSGFVTPNVSAWEIESGETVVNFNGTKPDIEAQHEYVDLGLPSGTLWATENIKDENGNDLYFAWGETQGYTSGQVGTNKNFSWEDYEFGTEDNISKYNETDGKTVLEPEDDAATVNWGSGWKTPTSEQFNELIGNTTVEIDFTNDDIICLKITSNINGNTLNLDRGYAWNSSFIETDGDGGYCFQSWTANLSNNNKNLSNAFKFFEGSSTDVSPLLRNIGTIIIPVKNS